MKIYHGEIKYTNLISCHCVIYSWIDICAHDDKGVLVHKDPIYSEQKNFLESNTYVD